MVRTERHRRSAASAATLPAHAWYNKAKGVQLQQELHILETAARERELQRGLWSSSDREARMWAELHDRSRGQVHVAPGGLAVHPTGVFGSAAGRLGGESTGWPDWTVR